MNLKSYFAATVESAMALAAKELGPEAMLIYTREAPEESRQWGRYEVVFGWEKWNPGEPDTPRPGQESVTEAVGPKEAPVRAERDSGPGESVLRSAPRQLKMAIRAPGEIPDSAVKTRPETVVERTLGFDAGAGKREPLRPGKTAAASPLGAPDGGSHGVGWPFGGRSGGDRSQNVVELSPDGAWPQALEGDGFSPELARWLAAQCALEPDLSAPSPGFWKTLAGRIPMAAADAERRWSAVVIAGPPGVGKTTALARLALRLGVNAGRRVHLVSTDGNRIGGGQRLERYAELVGAVHSVADSVAMLEGILRSEPPGRLVLVEAAGWLSDNGAAWSALRRRNTPLQVQLLLPMTYRRQELDRVFERYGVLEPDFLVAARADESSAAGGVCSIAAGEQLPVSYLSGGESLQEGLAQATVERLLGERLSSLGTLGQNTERPSGWDGKGGRRATLSGRRL